MQKWYVITTAPRAEFKVQSALDGSQSALKGSLFSFYVPQYRIERITKANERKMFVRPLFPRYAFCMASKLDWAAILAVEGVESFVRSEGAYGPPVAIRGDAIEMLKAREARGDFDQLIVEARPTKRRARWVNLLDGLLHPVVA